MTDFASAGAPVPLLTSQEILQLPDDAVLGFHRRLPPIRLNRMDWRRQKLLTQRRQRTDPSEWNQHHRVLPICSDQSKLCIRPRMTRRSGVSLRKESQLLLSVVVRYVAAFY